MFRRQRDMSQQVSNYLRARSGTNALLLSAPDINMIMTDVYQPGFLDDSINERINFYDAMRPTAPDARQISLIEAFDLRVTAEESKIEERLNKSGDSPLKAIPEELSDPNTKEAVRDEAIEAAITAIDINSSLRDGHTDLYRALDALAKAEMMNNIEKSVSPPPKVTFVQDEPPPEVATGNAPPEPGAEEPDSTLYDIDETVQTSFIPSTEYYKPLEILTYVGITKSRV
jgi:hypothetical protein